MCLKIQVSVQGLENKGGIGEGEGAVARPSQSPMHEPVDDRW
jgi:hypothetical protein